MKRSGFTLIEAIVALALLAVLVVSLLPVMQSHLMQCMRWEKLRSKNETIRNLVTAVQQEAPFPTDNGSINPAQLARSVECVEMEVRGVLYWISHRETNSEMIWEVDWEGNDDPIRFTKP